MTFREWYDQSEYAGTSTIDEYCEAAWHARDAEVVALKDELDVARSRIELVGKLLAAYKEDHEENCGCFMCKDTNVFILESRPKP